MSTARTASRPSLADLEIRRNELLAYASPRQAKQLAQLSFSAGERSDPPITQPEPEPEAPPALAPAAFHGLAGDAVRRLAPHSEADPSALLLQFLAAFGNLVGPAPHALVGSTRHGLNLFVVLVGETSKARKGTSWRQIAELFSAVDAEWADLRVITTNPTPAGILEPLRDQQTPTDRRLFLLAEEFAALLHLLGRRSGQLSSLLRCAWDGGNLSGNDSHHPVQATAAHISLVGHITQSELAHHLGRGESYNGFANRCLWTTVQRSQTLPEGGCLPPDQSAAIVRELSRVVQWVRSQPNLVFRRTEDARALWSGQYSVLSQSRPDVYGAATSRAEAQVLRLAALYAALDATPLVDTCHLQAALAVWNYCQASARLLFDNAPLDATARRINEALSSSPVGLSKTQIRGLFHGHISTERIDRALEQLARLGLVHCNAKPGPGRTATLFTGQETP